MARLIGAIRSIIKNRLVIFICTTVIGGLIGYYFIPWFDYTIGEPEVEILYPIRGEVVYYEEPGSPVFGSYYKLTQDNIYVMLHPEDTDYWWVQSQATIYDDSTWRAKCWYGEDKDEETAFELVAVMTDERLSRGERLDSGAFEELKREGSCCSNVANIVKVKTPVVIEHVYPDTGTIEIISDPPGAPFMLNGPVSYNGTTPTVVAGALVGDYEIVWGEMSGYTAPSQDSGTLEKSEMLSLIGIYPLSQYTLTISTSGPGITDPEPGTYIFDTGTTLTVTAGAAPGGVFHYWGGDISGDTVSQTITLGEDIEVVAYFDFAGGFTIECENPDDHDAGQTITRTNASGQEVYGVFGCDSFEPFGARAGYAAYEEIELYDAEHLDIVVFYSKNSDSTTPIDIYLDDELRGSFTPENQSDWNVFAETPPIDLGQVTSGTHTIKFNTRGQQWGVADLDKFTLSYLLD